MWTVLCSSSHRLKSLLSECGSSCTPAVGGLDTDWHHLPAATEQEAAMESCRSQPMATWDLAAGGNGLVSRRSVGSPLGAEIFQDLLVEVWSTSDIVAVVYMRISVNHNSQGCENPPRPRYQPVTHCAVIVTCTYNNIMID